MTDFPDDGPALQKYALDVELPEGAVPQHGIAIAAWFNGEGETRYGVTMEGEASLSGILGLLEIVKARLLKESEGW